MSSVALKDNVVADMSTRCRL